MLSVLNKIKLEILKDIEETENLWDENPSNDYYYAEVSGLKRALSKVLKEENKELNALDAWATNNMRKEIKNGCNKKSTGV